MFLANFRCICAITREPRQAIKRGKKEGEKRKLDILLSFKYVERCNLIMLINIKHKACLAYIFLDRQVIQRNLL